MLTHLQLRDLVIVDRAELEFASGLTALTGETGAGKSIIVDALMLIGGDRAAGDIVRQAAERAEVAASFANLPPAALAWLENQAIEHGDEIVVRRVIGADGRSRAFVNGQVVPIQALRELGDLLIEIHGQQEFQHLVKRSAQRDLLDEHLNAPGVVQAVAEIHGRYRACRRDFESLQAAAADRDAGLDLLRYQQNELKAELGGLGGIDELFVERKRIADRGRLATAAQFALTAIYDAEGDAAHDLLAKAQGALRSVADSDPELAKTSSLLQEAMIVTGEAAEGLRRYLEALDVDPARQEEIERRAAALEALARKHRRVVAELPQQLAKIERELEALQNVQPGGARSAARFPGARVPSRGALLERGPKRRRQGAIRANHRAHAGARHGGRPLRGESYPKRCGIRRARQRGRRIPGERQSGPTTQKPRQGRLRRRAVAHQPGNPSCRCGEEFGAVHGL